MVKYCRNTPFPTLYECCLEKSYFMLHSFSSNIEANKPPNAATKIITMNKYLIENVPLSILDDILEFHARLIADKGIPVTQYYFYKTIQHKRMETFTAKNHKLFLSNWECIFKRNFEYLRVLNLALSCNDSILQLIPKYCPNLEYLNATCKYKRFCSGGNATSFSISVSDIGLGFLCYCKKLKNLTINEPRGGGYHQIKDNPLTYGGIRKLLRHVKSLERISSSDLGSVIACDMEEVETLNLKVVRHFNGTKRTFREIFRLCQQLEELSLVFFDNEPQIDIINEFLGLKTDRLKCFDSQNLYFGSQFDMFFQHIGENLEYLYISNNMYPLSFQNIVSIGYWCPNLRTFGCLTIEDMTESLKPQSCTRQIPVQQFSNLNSLTLNARRVYDFEEFFRFCTKYATKLQILNISGSSRHRKINVNSFFVRDLNLKMIKRMDIGRDFEFTSKGIMDIIAKHKNLIYLHAYCKDKLGVKLPKQLQFINKNESAFFYMHSH